MLQQRVELNDGGRPMTTFRVIVTAETAREPTLVEADEVTNVG